ncbi:entericidin A/B family lipoprotein [uncultured Sphingomonas sp.]
MTRTIAIAAAALAMLGLSACNTVHGVGKDVKSAGQAVEKASGEK